MKINIKTGFAVVTLSLCLGGNAPAGEFEEGFAAVQRGDYAMAYRLWAPLANQGYAHAQFSLGVMYGNGHGVPQDYAEAVKWYRKAAEQGNSSAQNNLGVMYDKGQGVPQDYVQAHRWYNLAAATFTDKTDREQAVSNRDLMARQMSPAQIAEAQKLAREWNPTSSALGK